MRKVNVKEKPLDRENRVKEQWSQNETFKKSVSNRHGAEPFVFYEGPPTANGLPHAGHVLGRVIKDFVARYKTMCGYQVIRKAGWDTHGLPVELGVEKQLGISGKKEIEEYGIENFIAKCKDSVFDYERQWRKFTEAIGYWVDMDDPYITLKNEYIESVWNILATIHRKGLLYKGHRVAPYCPSCQTSLSSHEVAQGYKDVKDLSVSAKFPIDRAPNEYFLGWTTTPWTLPANVALAVNRTMDYVKVQQHNEVYIVAKNLVDKVIKGEYQILSEHKGQEFVGLSYIPPINFVHIEKGHQVVEADFVTDESGTGIVHLAPAYGEDDYRVVMDKGFDFVNVVDSAGRYTNEIEPLAGKFVKDCDVDIVKMLAHDGLLYDKEKYEHSYPHCWRCDSPLLYYAMEGWFIKTTAIKDTIIKNNEAVTWHPEHMKHGRFGKFLENMVDWNLGRNRYWGTPLNIWECDKCGEEYAPNSLDDLRNKAKAPVDQTIELHKPYVDGILLNCPSCDGDMRRTNEVIDVWFDSGSMPFAQYHYPFENKELFEKQFPADVIAEGVDQTRGWFYSLLTVSSLFTGKAPYKRVLSLGHILDEDGKKMSKSKGNVIDPMELVEEYGADALRWSLLSDSAPWNNKRFSKRIVNEAKSKLIDTLVNVHSFFSLYSSIDQFDPDKHSEGIQTLLDRWVLSRLNTTIRNVREHLDNYDFTLASRQLIEFVDEVSNWYIRRSRDRFWGEGMDDDKLAAYHTIYEVLVKLSQLLAPYTPFIAEDIYENVTGQSVHLSSFPKLEQHKVDETLEREMNGVLQVVELARQIRNKIAIKTKQPLSELIILSNKDSDFSYLEKYTEIIKDEINVKRLHLKNNDDGIIQYKLKLNFPTAGPKLGKHVGTMQKHLQDLAPKEAKQVVENGYIQIESLGTHIRVELEDILIEKMTKEDLEMSSNQHCTVILNTSINDDLKKEGFAREIIRAVQNYRKELNLPVEKRVNLIFDLQGEMLEVIEQYETLLRTNLLIKEIRVDKVENMKYVEIEGKHVGIAID
jgi:isoleucyl-tRNA synthetase